MDKGDILRTFMGRGLQLNREALEYFEANEDKIGKFLDLAGRRPEKGIVTKEIIESILGGIRPDMRVKVDKTFYAKKKPVSVKELAGILSKRYANTANVMSLKRNLVNTISINRISPKTSKFSLICMVKEINPMDRSLVLEDPTGTTTAYVADSAVGDFQYLVEDDIVGVTCENEDTSENRVTKIFFPDIPLSTNINTCDEEIICFFVSDIHMDDRNFSERSLEKLQEYFKKIKEKAIIFVLGDVSSRESDIKKFASVFPESFSVIFLRGELSEGGTDNWLPDPVIVEVCGVKIFLSHGHLFQKYFDKFRTSPENMMLQLIKKRHLSPTLDPTSGLDYESMFLNEIPDIFVIGHYHDPRIVNYKGTTIMSLGSFISQPIFWGINLKTRENIKISLT